LLDSESDEGAMSGGQGRPRRKRREREGGDEMALVILT